MEEMLSRKTDHYVMDVQRALSNITDFTQSGNLSGIGKIRFWNEINRQLEMFEFKDMELRPISKAEKKSIQAKATNRGDGDTRKCHSFSSRRSESRSCSRSSAHVVETEDPLLRLTNVNHFHRIAEDHVHAQDLQENAPVTDA